MTLSKRLLARSIAFLLIILAGMVWTANGLYQSHYESALRTIGDTDAAAMQSGPKEGRGDEWATYLPKLKQAANDDFAHQSDLPPYFETNEWFTNLPSKDVSLFFVPNQIAFLVAPDAYALSFQNFWYGALLLLTAFWLCRNLSVDRATAAYVSIAILFSHFMQVWWTSNYPILGAILLPFAVMTSHLSGKFKYPLLFWSVGHVLFGQLYPPFYIAAIYGVVPLVLAVRPELFRLRPLVLTALSAGAACIIFYLQQHEYIDAIRSTSYPGNRIATGGDASLNTIVSIAVPNIPLQREFEGYASPYEQSVIWTILPLLLLINLPFLKLDRISERALAATVLTIVLLAIYAIVGWGPIFSFLTGTFLMPGPRSYLAFSLIANFGAAIVLSRHSRDLSLVWSGGGLLLIALLSGLLPERTDTATLFRSEAVLLFWPALFLIILAAFSLLFRWPAECSGQAAPRRWPTFAILAALAITSVGHVKIFKNFNPLIDARELFEEENTQLLRDWDALYEYNDRQPLGTIGSFGHVLRGYDRPSLSAIQLGNVPMERFKEIFPYLTDVQVDTYFNRFTGIEFDNIAEPEQRGATVVFPVERHSPRFDHRIVKQQPALNLITPPVGSVLPTGEGQFDVRWTSWMDQGGNLDRVIELTVPCPVTDSFVTRYPIGGAIDDPAQDIELRGLAARLRLAVPTAEDALACATSVKLGFESQTAPQ